jgi:polysaccharide biosynthesis protein PslG
MKLGSIALAALIPFAACAQIPDRILPAGVGVNIHFTVGHERDLDLIAAAGFKFIRMDFVWASIERQKGVYDWSAYDELTANLEKRGLRTVYILDYSNPLYEEQITSPNPITHQPYRNPASPQHPESIAAFAHWAAAAARHFTGRRIIWEIWNEPNGHFWSPKPDAQQYSALALVTARAIREADKGATIVGPAAAGFPWAFLETVLKSGVLEYFDGVTVHPYRSYARGPETAAADYTRLREMIDRYAPAAKKGKIPVLSGEWGYATHLRGVSLEAQAAFAARQQLANLLNGVPLSIWYDWKNDGPDPKEAEHNFGVMTLDLKPKPAYLAIQTLTRELAGFRILRRHEVENKDDFVLVLTNGKKNLKLATWTTGEPHHVTMHLKSRRAKVLPVVMGDGRSTEVRAERGSFTLELTALPQYVRLGKVALKQ